MDRLWTPWRYAYATSRRDGERKGVPEALDGYPEDHGSVFLNLIGAVQWAQRTGSLSGVEAERAGRVILQGKTHFVCLNAYPYSTGHVMVIPYERVSRLSDLDPDAASEMMHLAQRLERALRDVYRPEGINMGLNLGEAAGAGVAEHLHLHILPRWFGDTNFMTVVGETRVLPELLTESWTRIRASLGLPVT